MKNKLIIIVLLLFAGNLQTQAQKDEYIPLAVEGAQWLILRDWPETPMPDEYFGYKIMGDTVINDTVYKKVYKREFESVNNNYTEPYEIVDEYLYDVIRDNAINRKVYCRKLSTYGCGHNEDTLILDYNIQIGDTNTGSMCQLIGDYTVNDIFYSTYQGYNTRVFELESFFLLYIFI